MHTKLKRTGNPQKVIMSRAIRAWKPALAGMTAAAALGASVPVAADEVELRQEIRHLKERVDELEQEKGAPALPAGLEFGGLVEAEGFWADDFAGARESDIVLATVELGLHAIVSPWVEGKLLFLYEEDETDFGIDEGFITLGNPAVSPFHVSAGQMYVPFGNFTTGLISDPLTLEVAETNESVLQVGFERAGIYGSVYAFKGDVSDGGSDTVEAFGGNLGFNRGGLNAGIGYLSNLGDGDLVQEELATTDLQDYVGGVTAYGIYESNGLTAVAEYVTATDSFQASELAFDGAGAEPSAYNLELGYGIDVVGRPSELTVAYQGTEEALALGLPETRLMAGLSVSLNHAAALSFEYARDDDYAVNEGGTGETADMVTVQLAAGF